MSEKVYVRKLPREGDRVETGPVQIGDDWPGVFIRGDRAAAFSISLAEILKVCNRHAAEVHFMDMLQMTNLVSLLESCREGYVVREEEL